MTRMKTRAAVRSAALFAAAVGTTLLPLRAEGQWLSGEVATETRAFTKTPLYPGQEHHDASFLLAPGVYLRAGPGGFVLEPFARFDAADDRRTHFDLRALAWEGGIGAWEVTAGVGRVFWGVTESQHLVDVVNQTDLVENPDGEDKLGQPMLKIGRVTGIGLFEAFVLPGFRERTFPGKGGRIRTPRAGRRGPTDLRVGAAGATRRFRRPLVQLLRAARRRRLVVPRNEPRASARPGGRG